MAFRAANSLARSPSGEQQMHPEPKSKTWWWSTVRGGVVAMCVVSKPHELACLCDTTTTTEEGGNVWIRWDRKVVLPTPPVTMLV